MIESYSKAKCRDTLGKDNKLVCERCGDDMMWIEDGWFWTCGCRRFGISLEALEWDGPALFDAKIVEK